MKTICLENKTKTKQGYIYREILWPVPLKIYFFYFQHFSGTPISKETKKLFGGKVTETKSTTKQIKLQNTYYLTPKNSWPVIR